MLNNIYFREYRTKLGFNNQNKIKEFLGAKDITPTVDYQYLTLLNQRLVEIIKKLNLVVVSKIRLRNIDKFCQENIFNAFKIMQDNDIISKLNNQGRRPEQVYFSWIRGFMVSNYFLKAIGYIFDISINNIELIGDDDLKNIDNFKRTPKADLQITFNNEIIRIEIQSGFQNINDIKQHKVLKS